MGTEVRLTVKPSMIVEYGGRLHREVPRCPLVGMWYKS
jgi:hypothetical protein